MGAYTLLQDLTVATNSTSVVLNDFGTITKDDFVKVIFSVASVNTNGQYRIFPNANTTNTNYHVQTLVAEGTSVSAGRINFNSIGYSFGTSFTPYFYGYIKISENNKFNMMFNMRQTTTTDSNKMNLDFRYCTQTGGADTTSITSLTFQSEAANTISAGSRIQIYKLDAVKVADITVTSNTTQVDISNLSIDKDSEYLMVSDVTETTGGSFFLTPNDLTTTSGYHTQQIFGNGTGASAARQNEPRLHDGGGINQLSYTHIKLSNIGAFTAQSYAIRGTGISNIMLRNAFISSTSEAITSITKLNIRAQNSNAIGTGSRFILYKLYE